MLLDDHEEEHEAPADAPVKAVDTTQVPLAELTEEERCLVWTTLEAKRRDWGATYRITTGSFCTSMPGGVWTQTHKK
eukprot:1476753-Lingulodinium_polyedra.AAC.1